MAHFIHWMRLYVLYETIKRTRTHLNKKSPHCSCCWLKGLSNLKFLHGMKVESTQIVYNWNLSHTLILFSKHFSFVFIMSFSLCKLFLVLPTLNQLNILQLYIKSFVTPIHYCLANIDVRTIQQMKFEWAELHTWCMILFNSFFFHVLGLSCLYYNDELLWSFLFALVSCHARELNLCVLTSTKA